MNIQKLILEGFSLKIGKVVKLAAPNEIVTQRWPLLGPCESPVKSTSFPSVLRIIVEKVEGKCERKCP